MLRPGPGVAVLGDAECLYWRQHQGRWTMFYAPIFHSDSKRLEPSNKHEGWGCAYSSSMPLSHVHVTYGLELFQFLNWSDECLMWWVMSACIMLLYSYKNFKALITLSDYNINQNLKLSYHTSLLFQFLLSLMLIFESIIGTCCSWGQKEQEINERRDSSLFLSSELAYGNMCTNRFRKNHDYA